MNTSVLKRHHPNHSLVLVVALGLLASIALAAATFEWPDDDPALLPDTQAELALLAKQQRYYDAKMARIEAMEADAQYGAPALDIVPEPHQSLLEGDEPGIDVFRPVPMEQPPHESTVVNQLSSVADVAAETQEDTSATITLTGTDPDSNSLTYSVDSPSHGTLGAVSTPACVTADRLTTCTTTVSYTPAAHYNGPDAFTYRANDGQLDSAGAQVTIMVTPVNDAPQASATPPRLAIDEDAGDQAITLAGGDTETPATELQLQVIALPVHGVLMKPDGSPVTASDVFTGSPGLTYSPHADFNGLDALTFRVADSGDNGAVPLSADASVAIEVRPINDPPTAPDVQVVAVHSGSTLTVTLSGHDIDSNSLSFQSGGGPSEGTLSAIGAPACTPAGAGVTCTATVDYSASANYTGDDIFTYAASAGEMLSTPATVIIAVKNEAPIADAQSVTLDEDASASITLTGSDPDGDGLTFAVVTPPQHGTLSGVAPGLVYTPEPNYHGQDAIEFSVSDGRAEPALATIAITVTPVNDPPAIASDPVTTLLLETVAGEGTLVDLSAWSVVQYELGNQPDANWAIDASQANATQTETADASILLSDVSPRDEQFAGSVRVGANSADDFIGVVFGYQDAQHFYLFDWKQADQDDPLGFAERGMSIKVVDADTGLTGADLWPTNGAGVRVRSLFHNTIGWQNDIDYQFSLVLHPGGFTLTVRGGDAVLASVTLQDSTYPAGRVGFYSYGQDNVTYQGFRTTAPTAGTYRYDVDAQDSDGGALTYALVTAPAGMTIDPATGEIVWDATSRDLGDHAVTVRVDDGNGGSAEQSFSISVANQNHPPVITSVPVTTGTEGQPYAYTVAASDPDAGDVLSFALDVAPAGMTIAATGLITWTPGHDQLGEHGVTVRVEDAGGLVATQGFTISVGSAAQAPVAMDDALRVTEDQTLTLPAPGILANDSDADLDVLTAALVDDVAHGTLALGADGSLTYTPDVDFYGLDSFTYRASDGALDSNVATVTIAVEAVGDVTSRP